MQAKVGDVVDIHFESKAIVKGQPSREKVARKGVVTWAGGAYVSARVLLAEGDDLVLPGNAAPIAPNVVEVGNLSYGEGVGCWYEDRDRPQGSGPGGAEHPLAKDYAEKVAKLKAAVGLVPSEAKPKSSKTSK
jgi:hypothetical protein